MDLHVVCDGGLTHAAMQPASTYTAFSARYALHRENGRFEFSSLTRGVKSQILSNNKSDWGNTNTKRIVDLDG